MRVVTLQQPSGGFFGRLRLPLNDVRGDECAAGCGGNGDAWTKGLRHSEATPVAVESPMEEQCTPAVDARGSPPPPSSSRSGDPPWRAGRCVRGRGDQRSPSFRGHASGRGIPLPRLGREPSVADRGRKLRPQARFEANRRIAAALRPRWRSKGASAAFDAKRTRSRADFATTQGLGCTSSLPCTNHRGDSRAERGNDSRV